MKLLIINGPNLNLLGLREPDVYGSRNYAELVRMIDRHAVELGVECAVFQSNHEGAIVDRIQQAYYEGVDGVVINPAAYTHTSVALLDALKAVSIPAVEVHISNGSEREDFRQISHVRLAAIATIAGKGFEGYLEAMDLLKERLS